MSKKKLIKSKSNFTLKRMHQSGSYGTIYERDYLTIANTGAAPEGQIPIYNSPSFKLSVRKGLNGQKKYKYSNWLNNPNNCVGDGNMWTLNCMPAPEILKKDIKLKPDCRNLTEFACYGSTFELIRASLDDIILNFPAELYVGNTTLNDTGILSWEAIDNNARIRNYGTYYIVENPFSIDITQLVKPENSTISDSRFFCLYYDKYIIKKEGKEDIKITSWEINSEPDKECLHEGDLLCTVTLNKNTDSELSILCFYYCESLLYVTEKSDFRIRLNQENINVFFNNLDDFQKILLNQYTNYTAKFETFIEDEEIGWYKVVKSYTWPTDKGNWNISISGKDYTEYIDELSRLSIAYDSLYTDSIWRTMTHEAISNMDLSFTRNNEEIEVPNSSKLKRVLSIIGRQFDEIKRYADNIKNTNTITFDENKNIPDYFLSDKLNLAGWETHEILNEISTDITTEPMYGARTIGYNKTDANFEFMRRLFLNTKQIFSEKGTKRAIEDLMAVFGYHSTDWLQRYYNTLKDEDLRKAFVMVEYVYVTDGYSNLIDGDTVTSEVMRINQLKDSFNNDLDTETPINFYQGLPVAEVTVNGKTRIIPWIDKNLEYDSKMYFQMNGGWARNDGDNTQNGYYELTNTKIHFVHTIENLYELIYVNLDEFGLYYVADEQNYYKLKDKEKYDTIEGWELASNEEILKFENIIENNKGNNPHSGNYDGGISYLECFGTLFKDSEFSNARTEDIKSFDEYGFNLSKQADSTKCLFFGEGYTDSDIALRGANRIQPYNFFSEASEDMYNEEASFSVINSKELHIIFDDSTREFIEKDILPYLKQIIPSTTIFSYSFEHLDGNNNKIYEARSYQIICDGDSCPIYGVK